MKTLPHSAHILSNRHEGKLLTLTDVQDQELLKLPDVEAPSKRPGLRPTVNRHGAGSRTFLCPGRPEFLLNVKVSNVDRKLSRSLVDIREHAEESEPTQMTVTPAENSPKRFGSKLLANRETGKKEMPQITVGDKVTQILVKSADSSPAPPERHRPYLKSLSQRELSAEEKENGLPDIFSSDKGTSSPNNKAGSSTVPLLPKLSKTRAVSLGNLHWKTETPPLASLCLPSQQDKKQRARCLWRKAGEKLGLHPNSTDGGDQPTWVLGPGDVLRPVYFRWQGRRNALADPERMCMPQEVRERIQQDVHNRKRSVARKVSNYLTCRLGLNLEVDLAAC